MIARILVALIALYITFWLLSPAHSQIIHLRCGPAEKAIAHHEKRGDQPLHTGIINDRVRVTVFVGDDGKWFMVGFGVDGNACLIASGSDWETTRAKPAGLPL